MWIGGLYTDVCFEIDFLDVVTGFIPAVLNPAGRSDLSARSCCSSRSRALMRQHGPSISVNLGLHSDETSDSSEVLEVGDLALENAACFQRSLSGSMGS